MANWWHNAIGSVPQPWPPTERSDDGRRAKCSLAPYRRFPLERNQSQIGVQCSITERLEGVSAEGLEWSLAPRKEGLSGLPNDEKPARNTFTEVDRIIHHFRWEHPPWDNGEVDASTDPWRARGESHSTYANWLKSFTPCLCYLHPSSAVSV